MKRNVLVGPLSAILLLAPGADVLAQATPVQVHKGLELSVTGLERATSAALGDCPPGANTQRGMARGSEEFALVTLSVKVLPDFAPAPIPRPTVTGADGTTYHTAAAFVDVDDEPEYACVFPFRVPQGTALTTFTVDGVAFDLSGFRGPAPLETALADDTGEAVVSRLARQPRPESPTVRAPLFRPLAGRVELERRLGG